MECAGRAAPSCESVDDVRGCSGWLGLRLPGLGNLPPYTLMVRFAAGVPVRFTLDVAEVSPQGALYGEADGGGG